MSASSLANLLWSPSPRSLLFALDGFRVFTLVGFDYVIGPWGTGVAGAVLRALSLLSYAVGIYGVVLMNRGLRAAEDLPSDGEPEGREAAGNGAPTSV
ncbi:MAG: hypothetical protein GWN06_21115, partial [Gemmatimonadetes bacterium]|nr:hypothetical protein [Gemmatimonadota bacterium]NIX41616.1 hypothetical protein [Gemmatimonadota bacterium]